MATFSVTPQASPLAASLVDIPDLDETVCPNVTGGAGVMYMIDIDNTGNAGEEVYVKAYDDAAPTVGTTEPNWIFRVAAGVRRVYVITEGTAFTVALSLAAVTTPGLTGTTGPTSDVRVLIATS